MTARLLPGLLLILAGLTFSGCGNECQRLCKEMADYWTECGMTFGDAEVGLEQPLTSEQAEALAADLLD